MCGFLELELKHFVYDNISIDGLEGIAGCTGTHVLIRPRAGPSAGCL